MKIFIAIETAIKAPAIPKIISGFTFIPFVSSSKNLNRPALEAGNGAFFFAFLLITKKFNDGNKYITVLIVNYIHHVYNNADAIPII
jgi:hypothetical protein